MSFDIGAWFNAQPKCPLPFVSADSSACVMPCPAEKRFVRKGGPNGYKCEYASDDTRSVPLVTVGATVFDGENLEDLVRTKPTAAAPFTSELQRFEGEMTKLIASIDKKQQIDDAFKDLQRAENVRDQSPSAYQSARTAYYTLIKGADWINEERQRVSNAEVAPEVQKYRDAVGAVNVRTQEQQKTLDVVNGIKDKVLSLRDDFKYSVNTFTDQIEKVKVQINMENRSREKETDDTWSWVDFGLNVLLIVVLLYAAYTFVRRYFGSRQAPGPATTIRIPTYTRPLV